MKLKTWLLNKLVKYAIKEGGKKKMQKVQEGLFNKNSNSTMQDVSIVWKVDEKGFCNCPYHCKIEKEKGAEPKKVNKRSGRSTLKVSKKHIR